MLNPEIKHQIKETFSKATNDYNRWANAQKQSADYLISTLPPKKFRQVLDIGCGTGFLVENLSKSNPVPAITGIDLSPNMINYCKKIWPFHHFVCVDAETFNPNQSYDLIVSNFTFQWISALTFVIKKYFLLLNKEGILAIATPIEGSLLELQTCSYTIKKKPLNIHPFPKEKDLIQTFSALQLSSPSYSIKNLITYYASPIDAIKSIKKIGAVYKQTHSFKFSEFQQLLKEYREGYCSKKNTFPLTYRVLFLTITKEKESR